MASDEQNLLGWMARAWDRAEPSEPAGQGCTLVAVADAGFETPGAASSNEAIFHGPAVSGTEPSLRWLVAAR